MPQPIRSRPLLLVLCALLFGGSAALFGGCQQESPSQKSATADSSSPESISGEIYTVVSQEPDCGGVEAIQEYVNQNPPETTWPWTQTEGRVFTQFVVTKEGTVFRPKVTRSVSAPLDSVALRAVENLECEPGMLDGKPVHTQVSMPVTFREE